MPMHKLSALIVGVVAVLCCGVSAHADCMARLPPKGDSAPKPIYEVVSCGPAQPVVEMLRRANPAKFGTFTYTRGDVVITVKAGNNDARKLMWQETEYWYYPSGCANVDPGMRISRPSFRELCCDVWPVSDLPCGVGGKQLLALENSDA